MARDEVHILSQAISDEKSKLAVRQLERLLQSALSRISTLETDQSALVTGVSSVTGSTYINVSPNTGAAVITLLDIPESKVSGLVTDLANKSPLVHTHPESDITGLVADLAARPTGSGTTNVLPKWTAASVLGDSSVTDDGSIVTVNNPLTVTGATDLDSTLNVDGAATLQSTLTLPLMTASSVLFAGAGGLISQDNANFRWDDTNNVLALGGSAISTGYIFSIIKSNPGGALWGWRNSSSTGYTAASTYDSSGTFVGSFGYANASATDSSKRSKWFLRTESHDFIIETSSSGRQFSVFGSTGNINIGGTTTDPNVRLKVEGAASVTGDLVVGATNVTKTAFSSTSFEVTQNASNSAVVSAYGTTSVPALDLVRGRGTAVSTTAVASGDVLGNLTFRGAQAAASFFSGAYISGVATQAWTSTLAGTKLEFYTTPNTASSGRAVRLTIDQDGTATFANALVGNSTLAITGLSTLTGGFTLGADSSANSHKITNLTNGSAAQDAAAFGQIGSAVSAAVSGTTGTIAKFTNTNAIGDSVMTEVGTIVTVGGALTATSYLGADTIYSHSGGATAVTIGAGGGLIVNGNTTLGDALTDATTVSGKLLVQGAALGGSALAALDLVMGRNSAGSAVGTNSDISLQWGALGYRHWISTQHDAGATTGNAIRFWLNNDASGSASTAPGTGNVNVLDLYGNGNGKFYSALDVVGECYVGGLSCANLRLGNNALNNSGSALYLQFYNPANGVAVGDGVTSCSLGVNGPLTAWSISTAGTFAADGNCTLGDAITDNHTANGNLTVTGGVAAQSGLSTDFIGSLSALEDLFINSRGSGNGRVYIDAEYIEIGDTFQGGAVGASGKGSLIVAGALHSYREFVAPQITADQNDYNPTDGGGIQWDASESSMLYVNSDAARNVTGLAQPAAGGTTGRHVWVYNTGSFNVTLKHQSASSTAGNRFYGPNNADVVLQPRQGRHLYNSAQMGCWIVLA